MISILGFSSFYCKKKGPNRVLVPYLVPSFCNTLKINVKCGAGENLTHQEARCNQMRNPLFGKGSENQPCSKKHRNAPKRTKISPFFK